MPYLGAHILGPQGQRRGYHWCDNQIPIIAAATIMEGAHVFFLPHEACCGWESAGPDAHGGTPWARPLPPRGMLTRLAPQHVSLENRRGWGKANMAKRSAEGMQLAKILSIGAKEGCAKGGVCKLQAVHYAV